MKWTPRLEWFAVRYGWTRKDDVSAVPGLSMAQTGQMRSSDCASADATMAGSTGASAAGANWACNDEPSVLCDILTDNARRRRPSLQAHENPMIWEGITV